MPKNWMIYGAYGFTGKLILDEALQRGHRPLLAGRSAEKLLPLAERFGLEARVINLEDERKLRSELAAVDLVFHSAGPYSQTSRPMLAACLETQTHYLDITGELPVFQHTLSLNTEAQNAGVCLVSGAGFDVVPTDCLAVHLAQRVDQPQHLELAIAGMGGGISSGTLKSGIEIFAGGGLARRKGELVQLPMGSGLMEVRLRNRTLTMMPGPLGDLITAYASTGIPNITAYMGQNARTVPLVRIFGPMLHALLQNNRLRRWLQLAAGRFAQGPSREAQFAHRSFAWGRVIGIDGNSVEAALEMPETYRFTALAAVRAVEHVLEHAPTGALTPAQAFGVDFVKAIPGVVTEGYS
jgi:short subunit dehydrogenase-like uncharacterized protein